MAGNLKGKGRSRSAYQELYINPLPLLPTPPTSFKFLASLPHSLGGGVKIENPRCVGIFDAPTRSVWIVNARDRDVLWRRGFFGKGNLSRSEPSWRNRRVNQLGGAKVLTSEEVTAQRRAERARFKEERERAIAEAAAQAEALFRTEGKLPEAPAEHISTTVRANMAAAKKSAKNVTIVEENTPASTPGVNGAVENSTPGADATETIPVVEQVEEKVEVEVEDMEHLQLTLQEAFFLAWGLDCLSVLDPRTSLYLSLEQLWLASLQSSSSLPTPILLSLAPADAEASWRRLDNPFLVNYAVYHHFRSLGWVVKSGIKFCVDYLLYRRGPVFAHAEFSIVVCPVYEDPADEESSPFDLQNTKPFSWAWLSTLNRVNTQVRKSLMIAYVTIPASRRVPISALDSPDALAEYSVREVTVKRFIPARMRD